MHADTEKNEDVFMQNFKYCRQISGLSQKKLGDKMHLSTSVISAYELGKAHPPLPSLIKIASFFGVSLDWLCGYKPVRYDPEWPGSSRRNRYGD